MKQTLVAVVALQYFCGSGHTISNVEAQKSIIMMIICIFLRNNKTSKARNIVKYYTFLSVAMEMLVTMTIL